MDIQDISEQLIITKKIRTIPPPKKKKIYVILKERNCQKIKRFNFIYSFIYLVSLFNLDFTEIQILVTKFS